jgi:hypothetical protein
LDTVGISQVHYTQDCLSKEVEGIGDGGHSRMEHKERLSPGNSEYRLWEGQKVSGLRGVASLANCSEVQMMP